MLPLIRNRKIPPSSKLVNDWEIVSAIVGITGSLRAYKWPSLTEKISPGKINYSKFLEERMTYVDETGSEIGLYPVLEALLIDGIKTSKRTDLVIIPRFKIPPPQGASVDFSITVEVEKEEAKVSHLLTCICGACICIPKNICDG